jgi:hypothetical protein
MSMKMLRPDSKGRIVLGTALTKGISGFSVHQENNGTITLKPFVEIPADEKWLYDNKSALSKVKIGLEQAKTEKLIDKGNFSQFANDEIP